jgi:transcription elongation factor Elf1
MSPGNGKFKVLPASKKIKVFQKEAKQLINGPYDCPSCGKTLLQIVIANKSNEVHATCTCGIDEQLIYAPVFQGIDYHSKFLDKWKREHRRRPY